MNGICIRFFDRFLKILKKMKKVEKRLSFPAVAFFKKSKKKVQKNEKSLIGLFAEKLAVFCKKQRFS
jgi:hypothetical protein